MDIRNADITATRSDGKIFHYRSDDWLLKQIDGFDNADIEIFKSARGVGDGEIITGQRRKSREITITARPRSIYGLREIRNQAIAFHSNRYTYDVACTYMGRTLVAKKCYLQAFSFPVTNPRTTSKLTVVFLSGDPDLFASASSNVTMTDITAKWKVTRSYISGKPLVFATAARADSIVIGYEGINSATIKLTINFTGYAKGIHIIVGQESATIEKEFNEGDKLTIDSSKSFADLNGTILPYAETGNYDFRQMTLEAGDNRVSVKADTGSAFSTAIEYTGRYNGL
ncbi:phage distal tail protein [Mobilibacterium timonense]|uniref:phage distal tail protein n=1 Tax=Mobilibacterium timonense TaxID=1871012 RepID=UPI0009854788|nr:phage tail family protein [Mobilibacterium timonense]